MPPNSPIRERASSGKKRAELIIFGGILATCIVLRLLRARFLDTFEDGYQNWWIAGNLALTGHYADSYSGMTRGNWLPGYHFVAAGILDLFGIHAMLGLKALNAAFSAGTTFLVYRIERNRGATAALLAASLFAINAMDIVISTFALPEALSLLTVFLAYYAYSQRPFGQKGSLVVASAAFAVAASLRYEVWGFLVLFLAYHLYQDRHSRMQTICTMLPAIAFGILWWAWTSQWGFFPATIVMQTSADPTYKASIGALQPAPILLGTFLSWYWFWSPISLVAIAWAVLRERRSFFSVVLFVFYLAEVVYVFLGYGNPGPRYIHLTIPIACLYSSRALLAAGSLAHRRFRFKADHARRWGAAAVVSAIVTTSVLGIAIANPPRDPGFLLEGMQRAGVYLANLTISDNKLVLSESPIAAYYSGALPSKIVGSALLPNNRTLVENYIRLNVAYVVYVTVPYYRLRLLFPEQANGVNNNFLQLVYDATGPEYQFGAPRVLVFRVLP